MASAPPSSQEPSAIAPPEAAKELLSSRLRTSGEHRRAPPGRTRLLILVLAVVVGLPLALQITEPWTEPWARNYLTVFGSLLVEALPFVFLGALASASIEVLVPSRAFLRIGKLPSALQVPAAALGGFAFPVCECGSVPVARRLVSKGLRPGAAVTFMLAAPILNPVVLLSTLVAYRGRSSMWFMVGGRFLLGLIVAVTVGWVVGEASAAELLLRRQEDRQGSGGGHAGEHDTRRQRFSEHLSGDFLFMGRFLVFGALVAAAFQTFVPQGWVDSVAGIPVLSVLAMMGLAFLLSLCSESDAFVAASFVQFGPSSQLAFLVFGPMMDTKLTALYAGTFRRGLVGVIAITAATVTLVGSLWLEVLSG